MTGERVRALGERIDGSYTSPLHDRRVAAILGIALGVSFSVCFATGVASHLAQNEPGWFAWPARPASLYRFTQGAHVLTGMATIPLLLAKLWVVYPRFTEVPPVRSFAHGVERLMLLPLVGGGLFLLVSGVANVARWYPWTFFFPRAHYWAAWITIGGLVVHVGAKLAETRAALRPGDGSEEAAGALGPPVAGSGPTVDPEDRADRADRSDRRSFLLGVGATSGLILLATAGNTIAPLGDISALAQRKPGVGPQGLPVNKSAAQAGVAGRIDAAAYRLVVEGQVERRLSLGLAELAALPQRRAQLAIACVEGWSADAHWAGVAVRDLLAMAGAPDDAEVVVESIQTNGIYRRSELNRAQAADGDTLLALELNGEPLHPDHGWPVRLIGPNRPGVLQTKWVERLVVR